jgi:hypothetical protein
MTKLLAVRAAVERAARNDGLIGLAGRHLMLRSLVRGLMVRLLGEGGGPEQRDSDGGQNELGVQGLHGKILTVVTIATIRTGDSALHKGGSRLQASLKVYMNQHVDENFTAKFILFFRNAA